MFTRTGDKLKNGAIVIHREGDYVLAAWPKGKTVEYVSWRVCDGGHTISGVYNRDFFKAVEDFKTRVQGGVLAW